MSYAGARESSTVKVIYQNVKYIKNRTLSQGLYILSPLISSKEFISLKEMSQGKMRRNLKITLKPLRVLSHPNYCSALRQTTYGMRSLFALPACFRSNSLLLRAPSGTPVSTEDMKNGSIKLFCSALNSNLFLPLVAYGA